MEVKDIINKAIEMGACGNSGKASDWKSLAWLFFSPQGVEFCKRHNYPSVDVFRGMRDCGVAKYGVHVEERVELTNEDAALIGEGKSVLRFVGAERPYKVILMHGAKARIHVGMYAVVRIENISGEYEVFNDGTATIL